MEPFEKHSRKRVKRPRRRRQSAALSTAFLISAATLAISGLILEVAEIRIGIVLVGTAFIPFVVGAWLLVHPERGGNVGRPDMTPWTVG
jgi:hypothetical protein